MKFGKEFTAQMVPEWHEAYLDYLSLKSQLKFLHNFKKSQPPPINPTGLKRNPTLYRAFSGLVRVAHSPRFRKSGSRIIDDIENQAILVNRGVDGSQTTFLKTNDEGGEYEVVYFKRLDDEFNKVLKFYKSKVGEVMKEAHELNKQMDALIAFRVKVEHPNGWSHGSDEANSADSTDTVPINLQFASGARSKRTEMEVIDEETSVRMRQLEEESTDDIEDKMETKPTQSLHTVHEQRVLHIKRPASIEILENVTFNNTLDTPRSTIKGLLKLPNQSDMNYRKDKLKKIELQLKKAFVEFYNKLRLLKSYSFLNILAISKIMKKYDKITSRKASRSYMEMVDMSYLGTSDEVSMLIERVEVTFVKHFANSNRSKGMNILRPQEKRERHRLTFSMGVLVGCTLALILALILIVRARHLLENTAGTDLYMETMFPLYSIFGFIVIHILMYAGNIFFWRRYRVNYSFIFGFKQGTELGYKEVMVVAFCISLLAMACVLANLDMEMDPSTLAYEAITELLPLFLLASLIGVLFCPFNIIYRSSRIFFLTSLFHCVLAPLYKVTLPDFLLADQLTSQVQALRGLEFYLCYYGWGDYKHRLNTCSSSDVFRSFSFIIAAVPFFWRLLQCLRRWAEEKDIMQGYNAGKYFLTVVAVSTRTAYTLTRNNNWRIIAAVISVLATVISTYWDIVMDWGLLQRKSKNRWLRDKLLVPHRTIYFVAIGLNILLRLAWMQSVLNITVFSLHRQNMIFIMACLEILRRGIWNFFRLENEHLNNVGKFRAFKTVPLPFSYDDDKDE